MPESRTLQSKEILKKLRLEVIKFVSVCLSLIFSISVLSYGVIQSKNSAHYGTGMSNGRIGDGTFRLFEENTPKKSAQEFQVELPGVFRSEEALQKYLLGFVSELSDPDKYEEEYKEWKKKHDIGQIKKDDKKTISLQ